MQFDAGGVRVEMELRVNPELERLRSKAGLGGELPVMLRHRIRRCLQKPPFVDFTEATEARRERPVAQTRQDSAQSGRCSFASGLEHTRSPATVKKLHFQPDRKLFRF